MSEPWSSLAPSSGPSSVRELALVTAPGGPPSTEPSRPSDRSQPPGTPTPASGGPIVVGLPYTSEATAANAAVGADAQVGKARQEWEILIEDLNANGGIVGRQVQPEFFEYDAFGDNSTQSQAACTHFTQDRPVIAVLGAGNNFVPETFNACLEKAGVAFLNASNSSWDEDLLQRYPHNVLVAGLNLDRIARASIDGLAVHGWVSRDARIGLVTYDDPTYDAVVDRSLSPALEAHGSTLTEDARVTRPKSFSDLGSESAGISNAVLRFSTLGIDHVMFLQAAGDISFFFMNSAETQGYRPRYGLNSQDGGTVLASNVPESQMRGAVGVGWVPIIDVPPRDDPTADTPARVRCVDVFESRGVTFPDSNSLAGSLARCDLLWMFRQAVETSGVPTADGFIAGVDRIGTGYMPTQTFATRFGRNRHDGAAAYRLVKYFEDCRCMRYTSGNREIG